MSAALKRTRRTASAAIAPAQGAVIARISNALPTLRRSERDVAELILKDPARALQWSIAEAAQLAGVSQPTVARFATAVGFSGFREFKLHLAQSIATGVRYVHSGVEADDTSEQVVPKVFDRAIGALIDVRNHLDPQTIARAVGLLAEARRIECFGVGNSAIVADDAQHKLLRFGIPCSASADPHSMSMVATVIGPGDV
ncbi:MAG: transcriptional regulator, partial [Pseudomonadota bacterium]|nr:transcriptional regulator [Pseudomonadota bacterium]